MEVRLAELLAGVCLASDLARGLDDGQGLRSCVTAMELADRVRLPAEQRRDLFWVSLLRFVGCSTTATELSALGDELQISSTFATVDTRDLREVVRRTRSVVGSRPDHVLRFLASAPATIREHETTSCEVARSVAEQVGLGPTVIAALGQVFERYDGHGNPGAVKGRLRPPVAFWQAVHLADLLAQSGADVPGELRARAGRALDPWAANTVADNWDPALVPDPATVGAVLDHEPEPHQVATDPDQALAVFAIVADGKSPYFHGHSHRVAELAAAAGRRYGLPATTATLVRRAGLVHDVGKAAVTARIWNNPRTLSDAEYEQVRLHPYYTQRVLARVPALAQLVDLACSHHERADGTGYHRGLPGPSAAATILAAADCFVTAGEDRPHRAARSPDQQGAHLIAEGAAGRFDPAVVTAILDATAGAGPKAFEPGGLTRREQEVLELVAQGLTNRAIANRLGVSPKTINAHLEHTYAKLCVSTRVAAVVHAQRLGWLPG
ncbi:HD domain-containing phosphohydrolase [Kribbella sp. NPDC004536]|uniref:HD domain-containing phosphohydrolase n=1 Tax=Kribbella sp. NPDC004536 TaxID=3364106 RepID=UPI0036736881